MKKTPLKPSGRLHLHLIVRDMKASIDFYTTVLGFYYVEGVPEMGWLTYEGMLLTLSPGDPPAELTTYFGWSVCDFAALEHHYEELHKRFQRLGPPPAKDEGREYFFLYDPDDYPVAFTVDPVSKDV